MSSERHVINEKLKKTLAGLHLGWMSKEDLLGAICYGACPADLNCAVK